MTDLNTLQRLAGILTENENATGVIQIRLSGDEILAIRSQIAEARPGAAPEDIVEQLQYAIKAELLKGHLTKWLLDNGYINSPDAPF